MKTIHVDVNAVNVDVLSTSKQSNGLLKKAGRTSAALGSLPFPEAADRKQKLATVEEEFCKAAVAVSSFDVRTATRRASRMAKFVEVSADGVVASVAMTDPKLAEGFPTKTGFEHLDPVSYALKVESVAREGNDTAKAQAFVLRGVINTYQEGVKAKQATALNRENAIKAESVAKLAFEAFIADCMKYIKQVAPKGHVAHHHLKQKRTSSSAASSTGTDPSNVTPLPTAAANNTSPTGPTAQAS